MYAISEEKEKTDVPTVFVIDDDVSIRRSLSRLIRAAGLDAQTYSSANDFMQSASFRRAACVLLDVQMPGPSGNELQEWMADLGISLPVVFLTGHADVPTSVQAMKRGAVDFLLKPVDDQVLLEAIRRAIDIHESEKSLTRRQTQIIERYAFLTAREREVMEQVIDGRLNKQIAADLGISLKTVKVHRARIMEKMGVRSVAALVRACDTAGILQQ